MMEYLQELKALLKIGGPLIISQLLEYLTFQQGLFFSGHLGKDEFDAVGLGLSFTTILGMSVAFGLSSASNTLMSQHFGTENKKQVGLVFQQALWFSIVAAVCCIFLLLNSEWLLRHVAPSKEVSVLAAVYIKYLIVGVIGFIFNLQIQTLLICQNITWPIPVMYLVINVLLAGFHCLFLYVYNLGVLGSALAFSLSFIIVDVLFVIFIFWRGLIVNVWNSWTMASLTNWGEYTKLAIPGIGLVIVQWLPGNIGVVLTALISKQDLGAQVIIYHLICITFMCPYGISNAVCVRVGNSLGAMEPDGARKCFTAAMILSSISGICIGGLVTSLHAVLPYLFSNAPDIIETASDVLLQFVGIHFFQSIEVCLIGVARGCGKQFMGTIVEFIGCFVIGLSVGIPLLFKTELRLKGLWLGILIGAVWMAVFLFVFFWRLDWQAEAKKVQDRICSDVNDLIESKRIVDDPSAECASEVNTKLIVKETLLKVTICVLLIVTAICLSIYVRPQYPENLTSGTFNATVITKEPSALSVTAGLQ